MILTMRLSGRNTTFINDDAALILFHKCCLPPKDCNPERQEASYPPRVVVSYRTQGTDIMNALRWSQIDETPTKIVGTAHAQIFDLLEVGGKNGKG